MKRILARMRWTLLVLLTVLALPFHAQAQDWPTAHAIRFIVPYPPGGASDVTARLIGTELGESLKTPVVVENRPGANGIIALDTTARAAPDGYTILMANLGPNAINAVVYKKLPYDAIKSFAPVTLTTMVPQVLVVSPKLPVKSVKELIAYVKENPGKVTFASAGVGSSNHLSGELFNSMAGIKMLHVPYKGDAPSVVDVMAGVVDVALPTVIAAMPSIQSGGLRAIAVTSSKRVPSLPDLPTIAEAGLPGFDAVSWGGVMAPAGTSPAIVKRLNDEINAVLKRPDVVEKLASFGVQIVGSTPQEFGAYLEAEIAKWGKVARKNNIRLD